jgi:hypothetical protein
MKPLTLANAVASVNIFNCALSKEQIIMLHAHFETPSTASGHEYADGDVTYGSEILLGSPYENSLYKNIKKNATNAERRLQKVLIVIIQLND